MLSDETKDSLDKARGVISELRDTAKSSAKILKAHPELHSNELDIAGASNKFLADTTEARIAKPPAKPRRANDPKIEEGWVTLRFRITEEQRTIINAAMDKAKEIAEVEGRLWKGVALEYVAADFLSSHGFPKGAGDVDSDK